MENSLDSPKISKEFSSYSSFYETQVSLSHGEREKTENGRTGLEDNNAEERDEKHGTKDELYVNLTEDADNKTLDPRLGDMNNNSSQAEKRVHDADAEDEYSEEARATLNQTTEKEISKVEALEGSVLELQDENLNVKANDSITGKTTLVDKLSQVQEDKPPPKIASPLQSPDINVPSKENKNSGSKTQLEDKEQTNYTSSAQYVEQVLKMEEKTAHQTDSPEQRSDKTVQQENHKTSKINILEQSSKLQASLEDTTALFVNSSKLMHTDQKLQQEDKTTLNSRSPKQDIEPEVQTDDKVLKTNSSELGFNQSFQPQNKTKQNYDTSFHGHERKPSSGVENEQKGEDREDITLTSLQDVSREQRLHSKSPSEHAIKTPFQDIGNNPVTDMQYANVGEERQLLNEKDSFAIRPQEKSIEDQLPETEHLKNSGDETDIEKDKEIFQKENLSQEESKGLHLNDTKNDLDNNEVGKTAIANEINATIHLEKEDKKDLKGEFDKQSVPKDKSIVLTYKERFETEEEKTETSEKQPIIITDENAGSDIRLNTTYDNLYFTGRLPSLLSKNGSSHSFVNSAYRSGEAPKVIAEDKELLHLKERDNARVKDSRHLQSTVSNNSDAEMKNVSNVRKVLTPSRNISDIIREIKEPKTEIYQLSRESPLSPRSTLNRSKSANATYKSIKTNDLDSITSVQTVNGPVKIKGEEGKGESVNMTVKDISMVTSKVLGSSYAEDSRSKFDDLPHMKHITQYVQENLNRKDTPHEDKETDVMSTKLSSVQNDRTDFDITESSNVKNEKDKTTAIQPLCGDNSPQHYDKIKFFESKEEFDRRRKNLDPYKSRSVQETSPKPEEKQVQRSSSENDLKAIIASAKMAISNDTETTDSQLGFETTNTSELTLQGDNMSIKRRKTLSKSFASQKGVWSTSNSVEQKDAPAALICSSCLQVDSNVHKAGFCTDCQQYLCGTCITIHTVNSDTRLHDIVPSYCKNELAINKYIPATGYCVDCSMFLCMKCTVQHTGFRVYRHHRIIQSSFVSKPKDIKGDSNEFLDRVQNKLDLNDSRASSKGNNREQKRKRKLLVDLDNSNPYNVPHTHVPESLYPGRKTKHAQSYTKNPKWAHSSIPNLPYLVQPKAIPDRVFHAAGHAKPRMIYTRPKAGVDAMALKLKTLKSTYKIKDEIKTHRRREQAAFTARPAKAMDGFSLPDIQSVKSHTTGRRSIKHTVDHDTSSVRKETEFINDYCLSIPFPRGEKKADIVAMTVLLNGKLITLDRNNNNIKLYNKSFHCVSALQFQNRLVDICASNICQTDVYAATTKHIYEISVEKGMELTRKIKVEIKRIEGIVCWKYGLAILAKKTNITWELRLLDYRGNLKSKLEIFNPFTFDIGSRPLQHMTSSRGGKFISLSDTKNSCVITVDVTTRVVLHETLLEEGTCPTYITSDGEGSHNLYVSCDNKVFQISKKGKVIGVLIDKAKENGEVGCIVYNKLNNRLYVRTGKDTISVYQIYF